MPLAGRRSGLWWLAAALTVLVCWLQVRLWLGEGGHRAVSALQAQVDRQTRENAGLQQRNDALAAEVEDLKSGEEAIEERARSELGMIRPGETFYRVVDPVPAARPVQPSPAAAGVGEPDGDGEDATP